ncbi:hypothetical protein [Notoacmeibacter sp. MSK16QG-6]|uniref:hypothetical protein n=1 Tax=Notoacmeibacter sp. MSK16QG-6 TaxID=2957982 RepID=UPI00209E14E9|nr:hypothetical protein [Notoacmeibacter sp. MSK16QG-6]MCP1199555.1 hypothetical protein [Notoacmeibacter sp. MSK16QG-6]
MTVYRVPNIILSVIMMTMMALVLVVRFLEPDGLLPVLWGLCAVFILMALPRIGLREAYLLAVCVALSGAIALTDDDPATVIGRAAEQGAFLIAFILLLGLLQEAASTSPSVGKLGQYLTRQPAGRRFYALYLGTGFMAVLFNIGVIGLLVPLIQRGIALNQSDDGLNPVRERRQVSATLRGFAWCVIWSPTAIAPLTVADLIPGVDRLHWLWAGFIIFLVIMMIGAVEDRVRFRHYQPKAERPANPAPMRAIASFLLVCLVLVALIFAIAELTGDSLIVGVMAACPIMTIGWIAIQQFSTSADAGSRLNGFQKRLADIAFVNLPQSAPVAITLGLSGFLGVLAAAILPSQEIAAAIGLDGMPDFVLLTLLPILIAVISLLALSPIMLAVFFGTIFGSLPSLPADPTLLALSISCGWSLSMTMSPFATVVLQISRMGRIPATTLTFRWQWLFTVVAALSLLPIFALLTGGQ